MPRRTLIVGAGYVGLPLARTLVARGDLVTAWVRSAESAAALAPENFARILAGSVIDDAIWRDAGPFDAVVHCASSGGGGVPAYREVFLEGVSAINRHQSAARRLLVSSTSVYGQTDGAWVDESSPTTPATETSQILVESERTAVSAGMIVVRAAGIYGPGRAALYEKFRRGEAVLEDGGARWLNQIHRDDLVTAIVQLLDQGALGEIYNAADNEPVTLRTYYQWCADQLQLPLPPEGRANPNRKRGLTNKRVSNQKLRTTGWSPAFPTFRQGLATHS